VAYSLLRLLSLTLRGAEAIEAEPWWHPVGPLWPHLCETYLGNRAFDTLDEEEDSLCVALGQLIRQRETVRSIAYFDWLITLSMMSNYSQIQNALRQE